MNYMGLCYNSQSRSDPVTDLPHRRELPFSGRRLKTAAWMVGAVTLMSTTMAESEVYFNDSTVTVSISEGPASPNCTVRLKPTMTLGGDLAPRLILATQGQSQLSFGVENPERYLNVAVVQNSTRVPFASTDIASVDKFRNSRLAAALKSQRTFFITAKRTDGGGYVSSRYERIDFDTILMKIEAACPFDAESLMTDLRPRQRAERALSLTVPDLTLIRWALLERYDSKHSPLVEPDARSELSSTERGYLKRYAGENGLTQSKYITAEIAARLLAEGNDIAAKAAENFFSFDVCNRTRLDAWVAISARKTPDGDPVLKGWWPVSAGSCNTLGKFARGKFYVTAIVPPSRALFGLISTGGDLLGWNGSDMLTAKCADLSAAAFERPDELGQDCPFGGRMIGFHELDASSANYIWSIDDASPSRPLSDDPPPPAVLR